MISDEELNLIVQKHEALFENKKYIYIPYNIEENLNKSLIIAMSTHNFGERYFFLKSLVSEQKCSLLFIKDPLNTYYLEKDKGESYKKMLKPFIDKYGASHVTFFGSSMAGYAALNYGLFFDTNIIVSNPQINFELSYESAWKDLKVTLDRVRNEWVDIDLFIKNKEVNSAIYYACGDYPMDKLNLDFFKKIDFKKILFYLNKIEDDKHGFYFKNVENVFKIHNFLIISRNNLKISK
ncbi:hypothetical protein [Acinetobacter terrestris]|uniref:hypothetical protein n=1 Tax=Acinetobacter terrestris TaxID=2529843 RepID=UPI001040A569|nr:hypothetical protein [Acinetobacter terrestris]TCB65676.1 hypothetical protein E0H81_06350 [Acinetobacter terrestris]